jgi:hypothetical protein
MTMNTTASKPRRPSRATAASYSGPGHRAGPGQRGGDVAGQQLVRAQAVRAGTGAQRRDLVRAKAGPCGERGVGVKLVRDVELAADRQDDDLARPLAQAGQFLGQADELPQRHREIREVEHHPHHGPVNAPSGFFTSKPWYSSPRVIFSKAS